MVTYGTQKASGAESTALGNTATYVVPQNHDLPDAIASGYKDSIALGSKTATVPLEEDLDQQESDSSGYVEMGEGSEKRWDSEKSSSELSTLMVKARNDH